MSESVTLATPVLRKNDEFAAENRAWFAARGWTVINLMSAPGVDKTTLLERTLPLLGDRRRCAVIEGDMQTDLDARRIRSVGIPAHKINVNSCHLDARMVGEAARTLEAESPDLMFIENIGNLVCPAAYDLGETWRVTVFSAAEGADKPRKYPKMFYQSDAVVLNKIDLAPYCDVSLEELLESVRAVSPRAEVFPLSSRTGEGIEAWVEWVAARRGR
jgi:hydrogenase nickel incorporation protein HypB